MPYILTPTFLLVLLDTPSTAIANAAACLRVNRMIVFLEVTYVRIRLVAAAAAVNSSPLIRKVIKLWLNSEAIKHFPCITGLFFSRRRCDVAMQQVQLQV